MRVQDLELATSEWVHQYLETSFKMPVVLRSVVLLYKEGAEQFDEDDRERLMCAVHLLYYRCCAGIAYTRDPNIEQYVTHINLEGTIVGLETIFTKIAKCIGGYYNYMHQCKLSNYTPDEELKEKIDSFLTRSDEAVQKVFKMLPSLFLYMTNVMASGRYTYTGGPLSIGIIPSGQRVE